MKLIAALFLALMASLGLQAQVVKHVRWQTSSEQLSDQRYAIVFTATMDKGWHLYSQHIPQDAGPHPTLFSFEPSNDYSLLGDVKEIGKLIELNDPNFGVVLKYYEDKVVFKQLINLKNIKNVRGTVRGKFEYMTCNDRACFPPEEVPFSISLGAPVKPVSDTLASNKVSKATAQTATADTPQKIADTSNAQLLAATADEDDDKTSNTGENLDNKSLWEVILAGIGAGLISLLMPCVWPIIPLTVSFFLKQSKDKPAQGRNNALLYGAFIMLIFVLLGVLVSFLTNAQTLNALSTNWFFNLLFFAVFLIFGISFIGYFEITLPSGLVNRSEQLSEKGGLIGIFFMAFTLVLVSFSCTLPFIGTLVSFVSDKKGFLKPVLGFMAYGFTLGLPFGLFAYFPSMLHKLPKSGGWMNAIKVTFGFLEIAFALIYLSKVDMAYHWGFLSREKFLIVWMAICFILGLYHFGKLRFPHDDADKGAISLPSAIIALLFFSLTFYLASGFAGNQLEFYSGFIPNYSEIKKSANNHKYGNLFEAPLDLDLYFDYNEALAASKRTHKPLFIDFTGHGCVNCRKMEKTVWPNNEVLKRFRNNFIMASLYVDDKTKLPQQDQYTSTSLNKKIETLGDLNYDIEVSKYKLGAQPYYVITDNEGNALLSPKGAVFEPEKYVKYLDKGIRLYKESTSKIAQTR